jgi:beta-glucosidase
MPVQLEGFSGGDRTKIDLPPLQQQLLEAVAATGKPLVVVLMNGSALAVPWAKEHAAAILEAWYPGEAGGTAIAETLAGDNNPAGRLPITFYDSIDQLPPFDSYAMTGRTYRFFSGQPLYGFGYGLSYTSFAFSHLTVSSPELKAGDSLKVEADVTNGGSRPGEEVAELYLRGPQGEGAPLHALVGFQRVALAQGETKHVSFTIAADDLSQATKDGSRTVEEGGYSVFLGGAQPGEAPGAEAKFAIHGQSVVSTPVEP